MKIKVKRLVAHCRIPQESEEFFPLVATDYYFNQEFGYHEYGTGFTLEVPPGYVATISVLESIVTTDLILLNTRRYSGDDSEVVVRFRSLDNRSDLTYRVDDCVAIMTIQELPFMDIEIEEE